MFLKIMLIAITVLLGTELSNEGFLPNVAEKLTIIGCLGFFLYYFMKELKAVREQQEKKSAEHEIKMEKMFERLLTIEKTSQEAILRTHASNERLADALEELSAKLKF